MTTPSPTALNRRLFFCAFVLLAGFTPVAIRGQQPGSAPTPPTSPAPRDDVIRINTDLAQTDVVVLDRSGRFVPGLQREQFELLVDKKPQTISFFDLVTSGSATEDKQLAAASNKTPAITPAPGTVGETSVEQRRTIGFFIDDMHMAAESIPRTRELLRDFIDNSMKTGDQVLIASSSGDLGFLQQFTESKEVLRAAVERLRYHQQSRLDMAMLPMTVYEALLINRGDFGMLNRKAIEVLSNFTTGSTNRQRLPALMATAQEDVRKMAAQILRQATIRDSAVLQTLESLARGAAALRGRKLVFFVSDGFVLDQREPEVGVKLQRVIDASARSGVVIYTVDTRGLFMAFADASTEVIATETHSETLSADVRASQEVLRTLAADTGGRAILNSNGLERGVSKALEETSNYYLIGWRPENISQGKPSFRRLEVSIKDRPDLKVFARRGFFDAPQAELQATGANPASAEASGGELYRVLRSLYPRRDLQLATYPAFINDPQRGSLLTVSSQLSPSDFKLEPGKPSANLNLAYVLLNAAGKAVASAEKQLNWNPAASGTASSPIFTALSMQIDPGLYQFRLAVRDNDSGRIGGSYQWIQIPEFAPQHLALSSLLLSERKAAEPQTGASGSAEDDSLNVARRFARTSSMLVQTFVYNAAQPGGGGSPQVTLQIKIFSRRKLVAGSPANPLVISEGSDLTRIACAVQLPLKSMPAGLYTLEVTAADRVKNSNVTQSIDFTIE